MSNIPQARAIIQMVLKLSVLDPVARRHLHKALGLMKRVPAIRRVRGHRTVINAAIRRQIHKLAATGMTMFQIAQAVGISNQGRISEVLRGKR